MSEAPLMLDRQSVTVQPDRASLRVWGATQRIFVSSLITDMPKERLAARRAIEEIGALPIMFEFDLGAQDVPADRAYLDGVRESGIYVGLFGPRYGVRLSSGRSATHDELAEAERLGLRLCVYTHGLGSSDTDREQSDVVDGLRNLYTTSSFDSPEDLEGRLTQRLTNLAAEQIMPWVRVGNVLLRAEEIRTAAETITIKASVYDRRILSELSTLQERRETVPFATHFDASDAQIVSMDLKVISAAFAEISMVLHRRQVQSSGIGRMSVNGRGPDDIVRDQLSDAIFGTDLSSRDNFLGLRMTDSPLSGVADLDVPERALRPVSQLLITEYLLRNGHASSVEPLVLGPARAGSRSLRLTWNPPRTFSESPAPAAITIQGETKVL